jgi:hypothetical protein
MAPQKTMTTRHSNSLHPAYELGAAAPKRKRATKAEAQAKREAEEAKKAKAAEAKAAKIQKVADLEELIAQEGSTDATPRPLRPRPKPRMSARLRRTETYIDMDIHVSGDKSTADIIDHTSDADIVQASEAGDTDVDNNTPAAKKAKVSKPQVRDAVDKAHKEMAAQGRKEKGEGGGGERK